MKKRVLTQVDVYDKCRIIARNLTQNRVFYGVPRGGIVPAMLLAAITEGGITNYPIEANYIVDDLIDSGKTKEHYCTLYPTCNFITLYDYTKTPKENWLVFPWEIAKDGLDESATDIFTRLLECLYRGHTG
jgi:hypoxanthine phosphoribosyltransferase